MTDSESSIYDLRIAPEVARRLGHYVYLYVDPRDGRPFYVGKGVGERVLAHLSERAESEKCRRIDELRALSMEPRIEILAHGLRDEETALRIEAAVIDLLGLKALTNEVRGWRSLQLGRLPLSELAIYYAAKRVEVEVPALLIRINQLHRHDMSAIELYEATRGVWKVGPRRQHARYAFAVFEGVVREVYVIDAWHGAATTEYRTRDATKLNTHQRFEFVGRVAEDIRSTYVGGSVAHCFKQGRRSPVVYANC